MARINPNLLAAIRAKTGLSRAQVYARIKQTAGEELLPNNLAAIRVGADAGLTINKFASSEELAQLRAAGAPVAPPPATAPAALGAGRARGSKKRAISPKKTQNAVFVVHGRDVAARNAMYAFLRAIGVKPIEWSMAVKMSRKPAPYVGEILEAAFSRARAIVVLMTPDDLAYLRPDFLTANDKPYERAPTGQARPNVLFEAGMAFGTHPDRTVIVELGTLREFSDIAGRHTVRMANDFPKRQDLAIKLRNAGCDVDTDGTDWFTAGDFSEPAARSPKTRKRKGMSRE